MATPIPFPPSPLVRQPSGYDYWEHDGTGRRDLHGVRRIQGLCAEGRVSRALDDLLRMDQPSVQMYGYLVQACTRKKSLAEAKRLYAQLARYGLETNRMLGESVVSMLIKCEMFADALQVFHRLSQRTVCSWNAVISGYVKGGRRREALKMYRRMLEEGVHPTKQTLLSVLKACCSLLDLEEGRRIHADVVEYMCKPDLFVGTTLVDMYGKCGSVIDAWQVFDSMSERDAVTWSAMIEGYGEQGQGETALQLYDQMREESISPTERTYVSVLKALGSLADREDSISKKTYLKEDLLRKVKAMHAEVVQRGFESDAFVGNTLVHTYAKCGSREDAEYVFEALSLQDVVAWTAMIAGYAQLREGERALLAYSLMQQEGVSPNDRTFVSLLKACGSIAEREEGVPLDGQFVKVNSLMKVKGVHAGASQLGYTSDKYVGSSLIYMYAKCGSLLDARHVFDMLSARNVVSWNAMIAGYAEQEQGEQALQLFAQMQQEGIRPDNRTFVRLFTACSSLGSKEKKSPVGGQFLKVELLEKGRVLHAEAVCGGYGSDVYVNSSLVHMYSKCGSIADARHVFDTTSQRNVVLWNAILAGYVDHEQSEKALELYAQMQEEGVKPNEATFLCILQACSNTGALDICGQIHHDILAHGYDSSLSVLTSLTHTYSKCGSMMEAQRAFDSLLQHDVCSWTALIAGYAQQGEPRMSIECFERMAEVGVKPDGVTFLSLLSACSHAGMVDEGLQYFASMSTLHGITPDVLHYAAVVDNLGRAGHLDKAEELIAKMPMLPDLAVWSALLGACQKHGNVALGRRAFNQSIHLAPTDCASYLLMSNIYAHAGMWDCAAEIDELRRKAGVRKVPGQSWIEHDQQVNMFLVGDCRHWQTGDIYKMVKSLNSQLGTCGLSPDTRPRRDR